jgi:hypothetical protein
VARNKNVVIEFPGKTAIRRSRRGNTTGSKLTFPHLVNRNKYNVK